MTQREKDKLGDFMLSLSQHMGKVEEHIETQKANNELIRVKLESIETKFDLEQKADQEQFGDLQQRVNDLEKTKRNIIVTIGWLFGGGGISAIIAIMKDKIATFFNG